jgi:putative membrane protein (TIGR04086 family)
MKILWGRVLVAGFLVELLLLVALNGVSRPLYGSEGDSPVVFVGGFFLTLIGALWVGRKAPSRFVLHGTLVGIAAVALYTALTLQVTLSGQLEIDLRFFAAHIAKILGGSLGGFMVAKRSTAARRARQHA